LTILLFYSPLIVLYERLKDTVGICPAKLVK